MSTHAVEVVPVILTPHPNADSLSIVRVRGWQAIVRTEDWRDRALGAYIPPDSVLPDGFMPDLPRRVRAIRLRGEVSEGLLVPAPEGAALGDDVAAVLGVTHYEPAPETVSGDNAPPPIGYVPTYDVENARRYADRWPLGTLLVVTEKLHGENWRATWRDGALHVSSRTRWKQRETDGALSHFWLLATESVERFLREHAGAVLFGECYGNVGGFPYDAPKGGRALRVFDVWGGPDGWWSWDRLAETARRYGVPVVPDLGLVKWSGRLEDFDEFTEGPSTLNGTHTREGAVVRPLAEERPAASPQDRAVLKLIGRDYLTGKRGKK